MMYKRRSLQRLFKVEVFAGDDIEKAKRAKKPKTETLMVVAWNDVDVFRKVGDRVVKQPEPECHVVMCDDGRYHKIYDTGGPSDEIVEADVA